MEEKEHKHRRKQWEILIHNIKELRRKNNNIKTRMTSISSTLLPACKYCHLHFGHFIYFFNCCQTRRCRCSQYVENIFWPETNGLSSCWQSVTETQRGININGKKKADRLYWDTRGLSCWRRWQPSFPLRAEQSEDFNHMDSVSLRGNSARDLILMVKPLNGYPIITIVTKNVISQVVHNDLLWSQNSRFRTWTWLRSLCTFDLFSLETLLNHKFLGFFSNIFTYSSACFIWSLVNYIEVLSVGHWSEPNTQSLYWLK